MVEVIIDRWTNLDSSTDYRWSVWRDGHRVDMGSRPYADADECEGDAHALCLKVLGQKPDKVSRL